jgi:murein DD-endopeptidase MepM/ murein hydrolase activator NlpD
LPLKGTFLVYGNNRSDAVTHAGLNRFCFDFMGSDSQGNLQKPGAVFPGKNSDYYGFGASLYSPVDGLVEDVVDLYEDVTPRAEAMLGDGNSVTIKDASGYHYLFAHIKKGSARVAKGQEVKAGDVLAELGNTGYTAYPHFHFGVYTPDWRVSLEVKFSSYTILAKDGTEKKVLDGTPQTGEVIKN